MSDPTEDDIQRTLDASPAEYWDAIGAEIAASVRDVRHAHLLNHQAAHLLFWAKLGRDAALRRRDQENHHGQPRQI